MNSSNYSDVDKFETWLNKFINFEKTWEKNLMILDTIKFFCSKFNHPETYCPTIHITGSKGKGSVSTMIASILSASSYKTGIYTSPSVSSFLERICTPEGFFPPEIYKKAIDEMIPLIESTPKEEIPNQKQLTWFELVTLYSFLVFRQAKVDYAVYEVGMGGLYDATNVISPTICCITPIELEHTEILGDTVEKIAEVKAGIIKPNTPVIIGKQCDSVKDVFRRHAKEKNCDIYFIDEIMDNVKYNYDIENRTMNIELDCKKYFSRTIKAKMKLLGEFQPYNAAIAALAIKIRFPTISEDIIEKGLSNAYLPGRFEFTKSKKYKNIPYIILDGAHTVNSVKFSMDTYREFYKENNGTLIFGCFVQKDCRSIAPLFKGLFSDIVVTRPGEFRKSDVNGIKKAFSDAGLMVDSGEDYKEMIEKGLRIGDKKRAPIVVIGSFYLVGEVVNILNEEK